MPSSVGLLHLGAEIDSWIRFTACGLTLVFWFIHGVRQLRPCRSVHVPSLDLSVVLEGLTDSPFEPLESAAALVWVLLLVR